MVQLSIRLNAGLRDRIRRAARQEGTTVQSFVIEALDRALAEHSDDRLRAARRRLGAAIESGAYADYIASIDDPDLRTE